MLLSLQPSSAPQKTMNGMGTTASTTIKLSRHSQDRGVSRDTCAHIAHRRMGLSQIVEVGRRSRSSAMEDTP